MQSISREEYEDLISTLRIARSVRKKLRYRPEDFDWSTNDYLVVSVKSGNEGVLLTKDDHNRVLGSYFAVAQVAVRGNGASKPYVCDFCMTWLRAGRSMLVVFPLSVDGQHTITYRCCHGFSCSANVRALTADGRFARTQLREDISESKRIERFRQKIELILRSTMERLE